ncbi:MAG: hypothetical protein AAF490_25365 [Chloroflexota bacterium]
MQWSLVIVIGVMGYFLLQNNLPFQMEPTPEPMPATEVAIVDTVSDAISTETATLEPTPTKPVTDTEAITQDEASPKPVTATSETTSTPSESASEPEESTSTPNPPTEEPENIAEESSNYFTPGSSVNDSLADGAFDEFVFLGQANQPLLFNIQVTEGGLDYRVLFFDAFGIEVKNAGYYYQNSDPTIPFTPSESGEYTIRLVGGSSLGDYVIRMEYVDETPRESDHIFPIEVNGSASEKLAVGAIDRFQFMGVENQPLLFTIQVVEGGLDYRVKFFDSSGIEIENTGYFYQNSDPEIPFTPPETAVYTIQLIGGASFGSYVIKMDYIDDPAPEPDTVFQLNPDESIQEHLAVKAIDSYRFQGVQNQPLLFTIQVLEGGIDYRVLIFDESNIEIEDKGYHYQNSSPNLSFTPPESSTYYVKIVGGASFGKYVIKYSFIDNPLPEPDTVFPIQAGDTYIENLAAKATDTYQFSSVANQTSVFTIQVSEGGLDYRVHILDENGNVLQDAGYHYQNSTPMITFTSEEDGVYFLRLIGGASFGSYTLTMGMQ